MMSVRSVGSVPVIRATTFQVYEGVSEYLSGGSYETRAPAGSATSAAYVALSATIIVARCAAVAGNATARAGTEGRRDASVVQRSRIAGVSAAMMSDAGAIAVRSSAVRFSGASS